MLILDIFVTIGILLVITVGGFYLYQMLRRQTDLYVALENDKVEAIKEAGHTIASAKIDGKFEITDLLGTSMWRTVRWRNRLYCVDQFVNVCQALIDNVEHARREAHDYEWTDRIKLVSNGVTHVVEIKSVIGKAENYSAEKFDISQWAQEGEFLLSNEVDIMVPNEDCDRECEIALMQVVREALDLAAIKSLEVKPPQSIKVYELVDGPMGSRFQGVNFSYITADATTLDLSFEAMRTHIGSDTYDLPASESLNFYADELMRARNVLVIGQTGRGKTVFSSNIVNAVLNRGGAVVRLDFGTIATLTTSAGKAALYSLIENLKAREITNLVLYVDEGQTIADSKLLTPLLEYMEGLKVADISLSVLCSLSAKSAKDLDPALVRPGRSHNIVTLGTLSARKVRALATYVAKLPEMVVDEDQIDVLVNRGNATLAEVWNCFSQKSVAAHYRDTYSRYRVTPPPVVAPPKK